jgi:hypothetical protein
VKKGYGKRYLSSHNNIAATTARSTTGELTVMCAAWHQMNSAHRQIEAS